MPPSPRSTRMPSVHSANWAPCIASRSSRLSSPPDMREKLSFDTRFGDLEPIAQPVCNRTSVRFRISTASNQHIQRSIFQMTYFVLEAPHRVDWSPVFVENLPSLLFFGSAPGKTRISSIHDLDLEVGPIARSVKESTWTLWWRESRLERVPSLH